MLPFFLGVAFALVPVVAGLVLARVALEIDRRDDEAAQARRGGER